MSFLVCFLIPSNVDFGLTLEHPYGGDAEGGSGGKETGKLHALKQKQNKTQAFDSPPRWGFVQVLIVTLEEQEISSCLSHSALGSDISFQTWGWQGVPG